MLFKLFVHSCIYLFPLLFYYDIKNISFSSFFKSSYVLLLPETTSFKVFFTRFLWKERPKRKLRKKYKNVCKNKKKHLNKFTKLSFTNNEQSVRWRDYCLHFASCLLQPWAPPPTCQWTKWQWSGNKTMEWTARRPSPSGGQQAWGTPKAGLQVLKVEWTVGYGALTPCVLHKYRGVVRSTPAAVRQLPLHNPWTARTGLSLQRL